jgi:DNA processing protein
VIVEARERSGALITIDLAIAIGRPIYATPGEITSLLSAGTNHLIRAGHATLITSANDLLDDLKPRVIVR